MFNIERGSSITLPSRTLDSLLPIPLAAGDLEGSERRGPLQGIVQNVYRSTAAIRRTRQQHAGCIPGPDNDDFDSLAATIWYPYTSPSLFTSRLDRWRDHCSFGQ
jgi:hypothetical protein